MHRTVAVLLFWLAVVCAMSAAAEAPRHGLMWNKTGLPAVFPLQVKTKDVENYYVTLVDAETGAPALAAYIEGGRFFKVLVPPGEFDVHFASGKNWENEETLFGIVGTTKFSLALPLKFTVVGTSIKAGHIIDLTELPSRIILAGSYICQRYALDSWPRPLPPFDDRQTYPRRLTDPGELAQFPNRYSRRRLSAGVVDPVIITDFAPYFSDPEFEVRNRPC